MYLHLSTPGSPSEGSCFNPAQSFLNITIFKCPKTSKSKNNKTKSEQTLKPESNCGLLTEKPVTQSTLLCQAPHADRTVMCVEPQPQRASCASNHCEDEPGIRFRL